jgi:hypothetical protein
MTTAKTKRWMLVDAEAQRLLDDIGVPDLEYYSAAETRAVDAALAAWPLLANVTRALRREPVLTPDEEPLRGAEQALRVVAENIQPSGESEPGDDPTSPRKEAG